MLTLGVLSGDGIDPEIVGSACRIAERALATSSFTEHVLAALT